MLPNTLKAAQHSFTGAVAQALRHRCGVRPGKSPSHSRVRIVLAVSGGADSVALLRAIAALSTRRGWHIELAAGHVQHHLRPAKEAEGDADFVAEIAGHLDIPFLRADLNLKEAGENIEALARHQRYAALATMAESFDARFIATGHHADDQLESLIMRLLRGSSVRGLSAMAWRRRLSPTSNILLIRPMLGVDGAAVRQFLRDIDQPWREDLTNRDTSRWRARLRHEVLPVLRDLRPDVARRAVALSDHLRQVSRLVDDAVSRAADRVIIERGPQESTHAQLDRVDARALPMVVLTGLLHRLLTEAGVPSDRLGQRALTPILRAIRDASGASRVFRPTPEVTVTIEKSVIRVISTPASR